MRRRRFSSPPSVATGLAVVAAAFAAAVLAAMVLASVHHRASNPLYSAEFAALKEALRLDPGNRAVKQKIRRMDLELRRDFFQRRRIQRSGAFLLASGLGVCLLALHAGASARRREPHPEAAGVTAASDWLRAGSSARVALAGFGIALGVGSFLLAGLIGGAPDLRVRPAEPAPGGGRPDPAPVAAAPYPAWEEVARNWPAFRGPEGRGVCADTNAPLAWSADAIRWKTPLDLPGKNSPVVWAGRVFVTGADTASRKIYALDGATGRLVWQHAVSGVPGSPAEAPEIMEDTGHAPSTVATDGRRVYAIFPNGDLVAVDFAGRRTWALNLGLPANPYGHAASLAVWRDRVIVQYDQGAAEDAKSRLLAIDGATGKTVWEAGRDVGASWSSPVVIRTPEGEQIIACANPSVVAYDPANGAERWRASVLGGEVAPTPAFDGAMVFAVNQGSYLAAIRPDGSGDVTETHVAWKSTDGLPDITSPLADGKRVYLLTTPGLLTCVRSSDGTTLWEHDLGVSCYASPTLVGDRVYLVAETGAVLAIRAADAYAEAGRWELGDKVYASPAFGDGRVYLRGSKHVMCVGGVAR